MHSFTPGETLRRRLASGGLLVNGTATFNVAFFAAGETTLEVVDTENESMTGSSSVTVQ